MAEIKMPTDDVEAEEVEEELEELDLVIDDEDDVDLEEAIISLADADPDTEVWTGGPKAKEMLEWMEQHGHIYVTSISFDEHIAWRPLKRSEYAQISNRIETESLEMGELELQMLNEEMVCRICVVYPDYSNVDFDNILAGIPTLLSQQILERSGFTAIGLREMI
jgi:hypothetical protein